jgi:hypothetical protein
MAHVEGSGTVATSVKFWFAPVPHVHLYVPGVTPRLLKVWLFVGRRVRQGTAGDVTIWYVKKPAAADDADKVSAGATGIGGASAPEIPRSGNVLINVQDVGTPRPAGEYLPIDGVYVGAGGVSFQEDSQSAQVDRAASGRNDVASLFGEVHHISGLNRSDRKTDQHRRADTRYPLDQNHGVLPFRPTGDPPPDRRRRPPSASITRAT